MHKIYLSIIAVLLLFLGYYSSKNTEQKTEPEIQKSSTVKSEEKSENSESLDGQSDLNTEAKQTSEQTAIAQSEENEKNKDIDDSKESGSVSDQGELSALVDQLIGVADIGKEKIAEIQIGEKLALLKDSFEQKKAEIVSITEKHKSEFKALEEKYKTEVQEYIRTGESYLLTAEQSKKLAEQNEKLALEKQKQAQQLEKDLEDLKISMNLEINKKDGVITELEKAAKTLQLGTDVAFGFGSITLSSKGREVLIKVKELIQNYPSYVVSLEGHTDNIGIKTDHLERFPSNWELSASRAAAAARYLVDEGIEPERLRIVGFGPYHPVETNQTEEGRAKNRRLEIVFSPNFTKETIQAF